MDDDENPHEAEEQHWRAEQLELEDSQREYEAETTEYIDYDKESKEDE